jgi:hypothetical protein
MWIKSGAREFEVRFHYTREAYGGQTHRKDTVCSIYEKGEGKPKSLLSEGDALLHPYDNFNTVKGRKIALTRALAPLDKELRRAIWKGYLSVCGICPGVDSGYGADDSGNLQAGP